MRYCPACGSLLDAKDENCPSCGARATTVDARPEVDDQHKEAPQDESPPEPPSFLRRHLVPIAAAFVLLIAAAIVLTAHRREVERVQRESRPVLALLRANQVRCVELDRTIRQLAEAAKKNPRIEPIGNYLVDEGSLEVAEIETSLEILSSLASPLQPDEAASFAALRALLADHIEFCRFVIDQPDGEPELFAERSDLRVEAVQARHAEASALVTLYREEEADLVYPHQDRIAEARSRALSFLLEEERRLSEAAFQQIEAADASDMQGRIRAVEDYELRKAGLETMDERLRTRIAADRSVDPLVERPKAGRLPTGEEPTDEELVLAANTRLWQPRLEEATRKAREVSARLRQMIFEKAYPPDLLGDCRRLLKVVGEIPAERIFPAPETFLEEATRRAIDSWRVGAEQCLEENFFALDSNLGTGDESWLQIQGRIRELTSVER